MTKDELEKERYFVLYLNNGEVIDFDKECRYVKNLDEPTIWFVTSEKEQLVLMMVPSVNILYIKTEVL